MKSPSTNIPSTKTHMPRFSFSGTHTTLLLFGLLIFLPLVGCTQAESEASPATETVVGERTGERSVAVRVREVTPTTVVDRASLPADLEPLRRASLAAEVPGTVDALHVREGQRVAKGDLLLEVDTRALEQRLAETEAMHRQRRIQFDRAEKLLAKRSITQAQFLDATTARDVALAQLESARLELEKSRLRAPWAGRVSAKQVEVGDYVMPGAPTLELLDVGRLEVRAPAPATDVPFLRVGLPAEVRVDVFPGEVFPGRIVRLGAELDSGARTLDVVAEIPNADGRLRPGLSARLEFPRRELEDTVLVPLEAVVELGDSEVVYVVRGEGEDARAEQRPVRLGPMVGQDGIVIEEGLSAGDRLIVSGQRRVSPGQKVAPEPTDDANGSTIGGAA